VTSSTRRLGLVGLAVLVIGVALPLALQSSRSPASAAESSVEAQVLSLTNQARADAGLPALRTSSALTAVARAWSGHMAATRQLTHDGSLGSKISGWSMIGENIAMAWSASQAQQLWMASSGHRANILQRKYDRVGVGVSRAADGSLWFTVDFEQTAGYPAPGPSPAPAPTPTHSSPPSSPSPAAHPASPHRTAAGADRAAAAHRASRSAHRRPPGAAAQQARPGALARAARLRAGAAEAGPLRAAAVTREPRPEAASPTPELASGALVAAAVIVVLLANPALRSRARRRLRAARSR
jgi:hypothetical protein